ncbi:MAG: hypothetical protein ACK47B_28765 [Armatimonadota bacterium]
MSQLQKGQEEESARRVEDLLRAAADFEADEPVPADFVWKALEPSAQQFRERKRRRRPSLMVWMLAGSCAVPAALAVAMVQGGGETWPSPYLPSDPYFRPSLLEREALRPRPSADSWPPVLLTAYSPRGEGDAERESQQAERRVASPQRHAPVFTSTSRERSAGRIIHRAAPAPVLKARWEVETVRQEEARITTPGWVVETDPESGLLIAQPGRVEATVPLPDSACGWQDPADEDWQDPSDEPIQESEK